MMVVREAGAVLGAAPAARSPLVITASRRPASQPVSRSLSRTPKWKWKHNSYLIGGEIFCILAWH